MELPRLQALWDEYNDQGFEVVAIESNRETERAMQFIEKAGLTYACVENGEGENEVVENVFKVYGYPTSFIVDRQGRVVYFHLGWDDGDEEKVEKEILTLLEL